MPTNHPAVIMCVILVAHRFRLSSTTSTHYMPVLKCAWSFSSEHATHVELKRQTTIVTCAQKVVPTPPYFIPSPWTDSLFVSACQHLFVFSIDERRLMKILLCSCASTKKICCYKLSYSLIINYYKLKS